VWPGGIWIKKYCKPIFLDPYQWDFRGSLINLLQTKLIMPAKEIITFNGMEIRFCLDEKDTNGALTMFECIIAPGARVPVPHYHKDFDETIYGIHGIASYTIDGTAVEIGPGDSYFIRRGMVHGFENKTNETIRFLAVVNPGIFGPSYFKDVAAVVNAGGPPDIAKMKEVLLKHGLVPVMG
jgi:quercetin dioxygenase-like cupin family protein